MFTMSSRKLIVTLLFTTECLSKRTKPSQAEAKYKDGSVCDTISGLYMEQKIKDKFNMSPPKDITHKILV